ncbi:DeoR/GlpR family DNA-binding transcription regulator [Staphylococcus massiliensis]|uniref:DeoR/GlpR family DNA-binding transcription regulator n=1 Tax=Staphylococcus massiliensis TaxID=555791 RepID=UPI00370D279A
MLSEKRYELIVQELNKSEIVSLQSLVKSVGVSESTIRRDLSQLQQQGVLKRVHGGAMLTKPKRPELSMFDKKTLNTDEKTDIGKLAAEQIQDGDFIFIDAGTTTYEMISCINAKDVVVVTNGVTHVEALTQKGIKTFLLGGEVKHTTLATIGDRAVDTLRKYRFSKVFLGMNGFDYDNGFTTPDDKEALIKSTAIELGFQHYILVDHSKYNDVHFAHVNLKSNSYVITSKKAQKLPNFSHYNQKYKFVGVE